MSQYLGRRENQLSFQIFIDPCTKTFCAKHSINMPKLVFFLFENTNRESLSLITSLQNSLLFLFENIQLDIPSSFSFVGLLIQAWFQGAVRPVLAFFTFHVGASSRIDFPNLNLALELNPIKIQCVAKQWKMT